MFTALKNWLATRSWRSDNGVARKERRVTRQIGRALQKEHDVAERIEKAFEGGDKEEILKAFSQYRLVTTGEIATLQEFLVGYKILLRRAIDNLEGLEQDIKMNAHEAHKDDLLKTIAAMEREIQANFKEFFQDLTSFNNTTLTMAKLVDRASQARDLYYQAVQLRGPVRTLSTWMRAEGRAERAGKGRDATEERKAYDVALNALRSELDRLHTGVRDTFLLLQEAQAVIADQRHILEAHVQKDSYPSAWAKADEAFIEKVEIGLTAWLQEETKEARILLSVFERAQ